MKILITGGNGYVAKSLYNSLKNYNEYEITSITRNDFDLTDSIATDLFFDNKFFDVVIHTAVVGGSRLKKEDDSIIEQNLKMWRNLLANRKKYDRLINFGSGAELNPTTPYGISKQIIRESLLNKSNFFNLRIFGVFDENEWETRFIKTSIRNYLNQKPIEIHQDKFFSFIYMPDLIKLVKYYIDTNTNLLEKEYDCCYPYSCPLGGIANMINSMGDYKSEIKFVDDEWGDHYFGNNSSRDLTSKLKMVGLYEGIKTVYNKLKEEKYREMDSIMKQAEVSSYEDRTVSSTIENLEFIYTSKKK